jgi:hypothetical protein
MTYSLHEVQFKLSSVFWEGGVCRTDRWNTITIVNVLRIFPRFWVQIMAPTQVFVVFLSISKHMLRQYLSTSHHNLRRYRVWVVASVVDWISTLKHEKMGVSSLDYTEQGWRPQPSQTKANVHQSISNHHTLPYSQPQTPTNCEYWVTTQQSFAPELLNVYTYTSFYYIYYILINFNILQFNHLTYNINIL